MHAYILQTSLYTENTCLETMYVCFFSDVPENFSVPIVFVPGGPEQVCVDISIPDDDVASGNADVFFKFEGFTVEGIRITAVPITIPLSIEDDERESLTL